MIGLTVFLLSKKESLVNGIGMKSKKKTCAEKRSRKCILTIFGRCRWLMNAIMLHSVQLEFSEFALFSPIHWFIWTLNLCCCWLSRGIINMGVMRQKLQWKLTCKMYLDIILFIVWLTFESRNHIAPSSIRDFRISIF